MAGGRRHYPPIAKTTTAIGNIQSLKINIEPETEGLEDDFPFQTGDFQVPS